MENIAVVTVVRGNAGDWYKEQYRIYVGMRCVCRERETVSVMIGVISGSPQTHCVAEHDLELLIFLLLPLECHVYRYMPLNFGLCSIAQTQSFIQVC